jgi:hypothetical protein
MILGVKCNGLRRLICINTRRDGWRDHPTNLMERSNRQKVAEQCPTVAIVWPQQPGMAFPGVELRCHVGTLSQSGVQAKFHKETTMLPLNSVLANSLSRRKFLSFASAGVLGTYLGIPGRIRAQDKPVEAKNVQESITRGLDWLKKTQAGDGHWSADGGAYPTTMTALAGMCFLMEGSSLKDGKYSNQIKKAVDWLLAPARQQPNGLLVDFGERREADQYMYGQGFATMFLACAYGECEDKGQQEKIERCLTKAVEFIGKAQVIKKHRKAEGKEIEIGGWGYLSPADAIGRSFDEGSVTITQLQALRAAKNATIAVPKETIDKAVAYLEACTTPKGGVIYSYTLAGGVARSGEERPPVTAAAVACSFNAGQYKGELAKKWIKYCKEHIPVAKGRVPHDEYQNYYMAQFMYILGNDRYGELFPQEDKASWMTWSKYKEAMFPVIVDQQDKSGQWSSRGVGAVFTTAVYLTILQLEKGILPIYQR